MVKQFPGPLSNQAIKELNKYVIVEPYPFVLDLEKAQGMYLCTIDNQTIFDWTGYYASKLISHNHPRLAEKEYVKKLTLAANNKLANPDFLTLECLEYYHLLHKLAPKCMRNAKLEVYAVNSGAEAVENMLKYFINLYNEKNINKSTKVNKPHRFVYFDQAFHGRTVFALNVTKISHDPMITKDFHGIIQGNIEVPFPAIDNSISEDLNYRNTENALMIIEGVLQKYHEEIVGIIVEPIQGAGGHRLASKQFFQKLSELSHKFGVYLGFDEVQTAGGQCGEMFAVDALELPYPPDAVAVAKKFGNGAVFMLHTMKDKGVLDSTWGGSLADMVRFCQEYKIVEEEKLLEQVKIKAELLKAGLDNLAQKYPTILYNVRGMGLYHGFSLRKAAQNEFLQEMALQEENTLLMGAGATNIRLRPSLSVTAEDISKLLVILERCLQKILAEAI